MNNPSINDLQAILSNSVLSSEPVQITRPGQTSTTSLNGLYYVEKQGEKWVIRPVQNLIGKVREETKNQPEVGKTIRKSENNFESNKTIKDLNFIENKTIKESSTIKENILGKTPDNSSNSEEFEKMHKKSKNFTIFHILSYLNRVTVTDFATFNRVFPGNGEILQSICEKVEIKIEKKSVELFVLNNSFYPVKYHTIRTETINEIATGQFTNSNDNFWIRQQIIDGVERVKEYYRERFIYRTMCDKIRRNLLKVEDLQSLSLENEKEKYKAELNTRDLSKNDLNENISTTDELKSIKNDKKIIEIEQNFKQNHENEEFIEKNQKSVENKQKSVKKYLQSDQNTAKCAKNLEQKEETFDIKTSTSSDLHSLLTNYTSLNGVYVHLPTFLHQTRTFSQKEEILAVFDQFGWVKVVDGRFVHKPQDDSVGSQMRRKIIEKLEESDKVKKSDIVKGEDELFKSIIREYCKWERNTWRIRMD